LVSKDELKSQFEVGYTGITQKVEIPKPDFDWLANLKSTFTLSSTKGELFETHRICGVVEVKVNLKNNVGSLEITWGANVTNDLIADGVLQVLLNSNSLNFSATEASLMYTVYQLLCERYENVVFNEKDLMIKLTMGESVAIVNKNGKIETDDIKMKDRLDIVMKRIFMSLFPLPSCYDEMTCQDIIIDFKTEDPMEIAVDGHVH
jgi:hypothetical protein